MLLQDLPIQKKLMRFIILISGIVLLTTFLTFTIYELYTFKMSTVDKLTAIGKIISYNSSAALTYDDPKGAKEILAALKSEPHIIAASLYDKKGKLFAQYPSDFDAGYFPTTPNPKGYHFDPLYMEIILPISEGDIIFGWLYLKSDLSEIYERMKIYGIISAIALILSFLFAYLLSINLKNNISQPIQSLVKAAETISAKGDYSIRASKLGKDELGIFTETFNQMLTTIETQNKALNEFNKNLEQKVKERTISLEQVNRELKESEQQIQSIFESAPDAVIVINDKSLIEKWNRKAEKLFGWTESEVLGKPIYEFIIPERYREAHKKGMTRYLATGEGPVLKKAFEIESINKKGNESTVLLSISPVTTKDKILFIGFIRDITEEKKAEEELQRSNERFFTIFNNSPIGMVIANLETSKFQNVNQSFLSNFGYAKEEVIGKTALELNIAEPQSFDEIHNLLKQKKDIKNVEILARKKNGERNVIILSSNVFDINNEKVVFTSFFDITERKKAEVELQRSNERFLALFDNNPIGMVLSDLETKKFINVNENFVKTFGYSKEEVVGKLSSQLNLTDVESVQKFLSILKQQGNVKDLEVLAIKKNGEKFWSLTSVQIITINNKKFGLSSFHNIDERKKTEKIIMQKSEETNQLNAFLDSVLENIPNMIFVKEAKELRFVRFNKAGEELLGYTKQELIGKNDYDFFPKSEADFFTANDRKVLDSGRLLEVQEEPIHTKNKGERILETKKIPILNKDGKAIYLLGISDDITEQKKTLMELEKKSNELERSNKELEQFAYIASHDLQEPLRMVNSYLQLLEKRYKDKLDKDANDFINYAVDGSNRMRTLIFALLDYSRVNRVKPFEDIHVNELISEVLKDLANQIKENNASITIETLPDIFGDRVLISQLFQNLISNAVKFKGERNPEILITGKKNNNEYLFSVKDNGIGIQKEYASKLFTIFQRLNTKEQFPGTGIGLAICKKIVERHGGQIWFESEFGQGTTFYFTIKGKEEKPTL